MQARGADHDHAGDAVRGDAAEALRGDAKVDALADRLALRQRREHRQPRGRQGGGQADPDVGDEHRSLRRALRLVFHDEQPRRLRAALAYAEKEAHPKARQFLLVEHADDARFVAVDQGEAERHHCWLAVGVNRRQPPDPRRPFPIVSPIEIGRRASYTHRPPSTSMQTPVTMVACPSLPITKSPG